MCQSASSLRSKTSADPAGQHIFSRHEQARDGMPRRLMLDPAGANDPGISDQEGTARHSYLRQHSCFPPDGIFPMQVPVRTGLTPGPIGLG